ncbi:hypothetical protein [Lysobacter tyrosinilyticus]
MLPTFGLTGMDAATETALKSAFAEASMRAGGRWPLVSEQDATHVVVDMDSMYGPMSWLRLHGAGKVVIGLTSAPRAQTDFRLGKPFNAESVAELLQEIAPTADGAAPHGITAAPAPQHQLPEELSKPVVNEEVAAPDQRPSAAVTATLDTPAAPPAPRVEAPSAAPPAPSATAPAAAAPAPAPVSAPAPQPAAPRDRSLIDWLAPGQLSGRVRLQRGGTSVLMDIEQNQYFGPATLKPLASHVESVLKAGDFAPVDAAAWTNETTILGQAQPLSRLLWFCALQAGRGKLMPGFDASARYRLLKWPQTEREFPKHFRIATAMMKGPATLDEVTAACGVPVDEVADFVNANLATGYAEPYREPEPEPEPQKSGLFGRLRGR